MDINLPNYFKTTKPEEIENITLSKDKKTLKIECKNKIFYTTTEHLVNLLELEELYSDQQEREKSYATLQESN